VWWRKGRPSNKSQCSTTHLTGHSGEAPRPFEPESVRVAGPNRGQTRASCFSKTEFPYPNRSRQRLDYKVLLLLLLLLLAKDLGIIILNDYRRRTAERSNKLFAYGRCPDTGAFYVEVPPDSIQGALLWVIRRLPPACESDSNNTNNNNITRIEAGGSLRGGTRAHA